MDFDDDDYGNIMNNTSEQDDSGDRLHTSPSSSASARPSLAVAEKRFEPDMLILDGTFFKVIPEKSSENVVVARCTRCRSQNKGEIKGYGKVTSNFVSHLKRVHGTATVDEYKNHLKLNSKNKKVKKSQANPVSSTSKDRSEPCLQSKVKNAPCSQQQFEENLVNFFTHSMMPLRHVEDPHFMKLLGDLNIEEMGLKLIGRRRLKNLINDQSATQKSFIKEELKSAEFVSTTGDIWSGKKRSFIGATAHWIDKDLCRQSASIACRRFKGAHTFDRIKDTMLDIFADAEIEPSKIVSSVTDNGSNFVKAFKTFGIKSRSTDIYAIDAADSSDSGEDETSDSSEILYESSHVEEEQSDIFEAPQSDLLPYHLRCNAHTLNLIASADVQSLLTDQSTLLGKTHTTVIKKCNELWSAAGRPKSAEIIQEVLGHTLPRPGITRWNSLYDALGKISKIKNKSYQLARALNIKNPLNDKEFEYIDEYLQCAAPVALALDILQGDDAFYGIVTPCLMSLRKKLQKLEKQHLQFFSGLVKKYLSSVESRFSDFFDFSKETGKKAAVAALSYPRFKNRWFSCISSTDEKICMKLLKSAVSTTIGEQQDQEAEDLSKRNKQNDDEFFDFLSDSGSETDSISSQKRAQLIVSNYITESSRDLTILNRYPLIKRVFLKYNTSMPSSGSVERMFSFATMVNLPKSHRMSDDLFEKRVVMKSNMNHQKKW